MGRRIAKRGRGGSGNEAAGRGVPGGGGSARRTAGGPAIEEGVPEVARYLFELGTLKRVRRSGWWLAGVRDPESVAEHSFRAAAIAWLLAEMEGVDPGKAAAMALFHDAEETRLGDLHRMARDYLAPSGTRRAVARDQTAGFGAKAGGGLRALLAELEGGHTPESRIVKDADRLECLLQALEYAEQGYPVGEWVESSLGELRTESGRKLSKAILEIRPDDWRHGPERRRRGQGRGGRADG